MADWAADLGLAVPSAVAVLVVVAMFLRFMREERLVRAQDQKIGHEVLERLRDSMSELAREIRERLR